jgi:hypothetical protein
LLTVVAIIAGCEASVDPPPTSITLTANQSLSTIARRDRIWRLVGVGSCTASGCHGAGSATSVVGSEYNIWISKDPHAQAHSVLYDERSLRMLRLLDGRPLDDPVEPYADARCVGCHSSVMAPQRDPTVSLVSDGVGCEACHGPAEGWLSAHYQHRFSAQGPARAAAALRDLGMWDTDDLVSRAQICSGCHVGAPGRDVNHDLIAAGHPRLQFDYAAYFRKLPAHWNRADDRAAWGDNVDAMSWAVGQAVNSQTALRRLAARAAGESNWPELSEWSCVDCHHDLRDDADRQKRLAERSGLSGVNFAWDDWHHQAPRQYMAAIERAWGIDSQLAAQIQRDMAELAERVGSIRADRHEAAERAEALASKMDQWISKLRRADPDLDAIARLSLEVAELHRQRGITSWSEAALAYDALASLHQSRLDGLRRVGAAADPSVDQITRIIRQMYDELYRTKEGMGRPFQSDALASLFDELVSLFDRGGERR